MPDVILHDKELSNSAYSHVINAPLANIDIAEWLLSVNQDFADTTAFLLYYPGDFMPALFQTKSRGRQ
jgi:hypothetical protein